MARETIAVLDRFIQAMNVGGESPRIGESVR
jgi:hypothetical protein